MRATLLLAALSAAGAVSAAPAPAPAPPSSCGKKGCADVNPFEGKKLFANPTWAKKLDQTYKAFTAQGDAASAAKIGKVQKVGTFVWVADRAGLANIDAAIASARAEQRKTGKKQIVGLVLYNLPDRDCSAGESAGELSSDTNGLEIYKKEFIKPYAEKVSRAKDLDFAIVLEPDSLGNIVTNMAVEFCAKAAPVYEEGIAYAIANLQYDNVHLYVDAAHGGWLGWDGNLPLAAKEFAKVVALAGAGKNKIRGFATNVSNYNPFNATAEGLPAHFIVDQGRVTVDGARKEWGEWCNVVAGFGQVPTTNTNNTVVDSIVWVKPGGESDGQCGMTGAPKAGAWFDEYVQMLVKNAHPSVFA
ncbi:glycoside hydrolase family 6 protein [Bombardia bombarda]|uniref:Glucanase n=1 Tax=Bombardia bombarda TaxID=252184 RepID=A0AA39X8V0_9PEZI|nr:glycoside hydrolase family 6 protein [Bombardia bombarda]